MNEGVKKEQNRTPVENIRDAFLGAKGEFKTKKIEWQGHEIEIRELNAKQRGKVYKNATVTKQKRGSDEIIQEIDSGYLNVWAVIYCCYNPKTNTRVFQETDFNALSSLPCSVLDKLAKPALELLGEAEEEEKN